MFFCVFLLCIFGLELDQVDKQGEPAEDADDYAQVEDRTGLVAYRDSVLPALEANYNRPAASAAEGMLLPIDADSGVLVGNYWQVNISCFFTLDLVRNLIGFD